MTEKLRIYLTKGGGMGGEDLFTEQKSPIDRSLLAYAFLAQATSSPGDLFSGLAPIFKPIFHGRVGQVFNANEFSLIVRQLYGIEVHPWAIEDLAPRFEAAGLLTRVANGATETFVYSEVQGDFNEISEGDIRLLAKRFVDFAQPSLATHGIELSQDEIEKVFLKQLISTSFHAILVKPEAKIVAPAPNLLSLKTDPAKQAWQAQIASDSKFDVLAASFIVHLYESDRAAYDLLVRIANGALVAEVVLNVQDPGTGLKINALTVVLDGPFVMSLLDLSGEESTDYARRIYEKLRENNASIAVFRHSIYEIQVNLKSVLDHVRTGSGFGPTARRLTGSTFRTYLETVFRDVESAVRDLDIKIIEAPTNPSGYQYFTPDDEAAFCASLGMFNNPAAQERDALSIASVIRLRRGAVAKMSSFNNASYVFITANPWIAERAAACVRAKNINRDNEVPPALTDRYFAGLLWVVFGGGSKDLTEYRLLANCATALEARSDVVSRVYKFLHEIDAQKAVRFKALMTNERAGQYLMEFTLGDALFVQSTEDALATYEQIESAIAAKLGAAHEVEMQRVLNEYKENLDSVSSQNAKILEEQERQREASNENARVAQAAEIMQKEAARQADLRLRELENKVSENEEAEHRRVISLADKSIKHAVKVAKRWEVAITLLIAAVLSVASFAALSSFVKDHGWAPYALAAVVSVATFLGLWNMPSHLFGGLITRVRERAFESKLADYDILSFRGDLVCDWSRVRVERTKGRPD